MCYVRSAPKSVEISKTRIGNVLLYFIKKAKNSMGFFIWPELYLFKVDFKAENATNNQFLQQAEGRCQGIPRSFFCSLSFPFVFFCCVVLCYNTLHWRPNGQCSIASLLSTTLTRKLYNQSMFFLSRMHTLMRKNVNSTMLARSMNS